ncbi:hypothetical protein JQ633_32530 [Bradyrhizobium tropiciagri]|uniref:hypothetical protein n=1 Tax=Bradyrhizobium tropiciagri TaxID=312253 RepID=UPI001BA7EDCF|nr:hypothetical protein [Bradyrhizobium tropiciagri]MBR0875125.1 hypothetical protein [Bradyrhizobium tropiciagri]
MPRIVFFTIHRTTAWWKFLASRMDFADVTVMSDLRNEGDYSLVDDFYRFMRSGNAAKVALERFGEAGCADIILRCRTLRSLKRDLALKLIGGMTQAIELAFDRLDPRLVLTFTMDRYVMDVMDRVARARGVDFLEMTASIIPDQIFLHRRGRLVELKEPSAEELSAATDALCSGDFAPVYVKSARDFSKKKFWKVFGYFALRGAFFNLWRFVKRDPYNIHFIDAQKRHKHKVRPGDAVVLDLLRQDWRERLDAVPKERRVFCGLQLFPEASLDYWLNSYDMLRHDDVIVRYCEVLGKAGYHTFIKDHPLQFGFRQRELFERLSKLPYVTCVPYDVPANFLLSQCQVSITFTGTIGFQAALAGLCSIVTEPYYSTDEHFLQVREFSEIDGIVDRVAQWRRPDDLAAAQRQIVRKLAGAGAAGNYFTWMDFDPDDELAWESTNSLVRAFNRYLPQFMKP